MNKELNQIKKIYGEEMMHLCRELFPSLLEQEGVLLNILKSNIAPTRSFASDIKENCLYDEFKSFVYSFIDVEEENNVITDKTPFELMDEVGYKLYECKSEEDIQSFRKYYEPSEVLCTINNGGRLERCHVFFAVKKNVDQIKRKDFKNPKREDEYGTSVISIQFSRGKTNTLSIKNRYNHSVNNPDATFSNNLDNIIPGLKNSFEKYYKFNIDQEDRIKSQFLTSNLNYTRANDGRYYRYNVEINGAYYCENNIIIKDGRIITEFLDNKERYLLIDQYVIDRKNKLIYSNTNPKDSFVKSINEVGEIECINVTKNNENKNIDINYTNGKQVKIEINKNNAIIGYENNYVSKIGKSFLYDNIELQYISLPHAHIIRDYFLYNNEKLKSIYIPHVQQIGEGFLGHNISLSSISIQDVQIIGDNFLYKNKHLKSISMPQVKKIGGNFLYNNIDTEYVSLPELQEIGNCFLMASKYLTNISLPEVKMIGYDFLSDNRNISNISLPKVETIGDGFLFSNEQLKEIILPEVQKIGDHFLCQNEILTYAALPQVKEIGTYFLQRNEELSDILIPSVELIGGWSLYWNKKLKKIFVPNIQTLGCDAFYNNPRLYYKIIKQRDINEKNKRNKV